MWALHRLEGVLPVWPGILECWAASHDYNAITLLDPQIPKPVVLKHEASVSRQFIKYLMKQKMLDEVKECGEYQLFMQLYVPEWDEVGQWCCLMVNQALFCIFIHPGSSRLTYHNSCVLDHSLQEDGWSLKELGMLRKSNPDHCNFMTCEGGTRAEISQAQAEIQEFLVMTLAVMLGHQGLENRLWPSSLRVSAWVNLAIITDPESKKLHYFITEFAHPFECWIGPHNPHPQTMSLI
ncbi:hypothetical protein BDR06DRAFT_947813 [Suillus hirtellus]|nr:hypothetical protein BDR06DRAFT_947813 [Suillus hirtellus]